MAKLARDVMTSSPVFCSPETTLDLVAKLMAQHNCGEIPIIDKTERPVGVVTDRDIVCRVVAEGMNPMAYSAQVCMSHPAVTVPETAPLDDVLTTMEKHQIRRVPVVDDGGRCVGIISQADVARQGHQRAIAELVREVSRDDSDERAVTA